jgi:hypothetical protein
MSPAPLDLGYESPPLFLPPPGVEAFLESWDPAYPVLRTLPYNVKLGADNPDNLYMYGTGRCVYACVCPSVCERVFLGGAE